MDSLKSSHAMPVKHSQIKVIPITDLYFKLGDVVSQADLISVLTQKNKKKQLHIELTVLTRRSAKARENSSYRRFLAFICKTYLVKPFGFFLVPFN